MNIRPARPDDLEAVRQLLSAAWSGDEAAAAYHLRWPPEVGLLAEREGQPIGAALGARGTLHPTFLYVGVHVLPAERGRGVGGALWAELRGRVQGPLKTATFADDLASLAFLERRGVRVSLSTYLDTLDLSQLEAGEPRLPPSIQMLPLTEVEGDTPARLDVACLHSQLYRESHRHDPPRMLSAEQAERLFLGDDLRPDWLWLAQQAGQLVGVSSVRGGEAAGEAELGWFGTVGLPEGQARQVTRALTVRALQAAGAAGVRSVRAEFDSVNPLAMWLREVMPWQPGRVWLTLTGVAEPSCRCPPGPSGAPYSHD